MTDCEKLDIIEPRALIVGLGNPGAEYADHRHNIGFQVVDALASAHDLAFSRDKGARARVAEGAIHGQRVFIAKPQTFMNLSGRAVARLSRQHEIPSERILVIYDDLDLPLGRLRLRPMGGSGGHKGMRSIIDLLGTQSFPRLRVGIDRPVGKIEPADYVLEPFSEEQLFLIQESVARAAAAIECWLEEGVVAAMDFFNRPSKNGENIDPGMCEGAKEKPS